MARSENPLRQLVTMLLLDAVAKGVSKLGLGTAPDGSFGIWVEVAGSVSLAMRPPPAIGDQLCEVLLDDAQLPREATSAAQGRVVLSNHQGFDVAWFPSGVEPRLVVLVNGQVEPPTPRAWAAFHFVLPVSA